MVLLASDIIYGNSSTTPTEIPTTFIKNISDGTRGVTISWKKADNSKYKLYRSKHKIYGYKLIGTIVNKTSYVDTTASSNTTYYYKVKCAVGSSAGQFSKPVKYRVSRSKPTINFEKNLRRFIKKNINGHYPCNVLVNRYVESSGIKSRKIKQSSRLKSAKLKDSPYSEVWRSGNAQLSYKYTTLNNTYNESGSVKNSTFPVKSTGFVSAASKRETNMEKLAPGDILVYSNSYRASHVAVYIGKFNTKTDLVKYLNKEVGISCNENTSWIKSWNGSCKHWVIQGGMGSNNDVYICNNANTTGGGSYLSHKVTLFKNIEQ